MRWNWGVWHRHILVKIVVGCSTNGFCTICRRNCSRHSRRRQKSSSYGIVVVNNPKKGGGEFFYDWVNVLWTWIIINTRKSGCVCVRASNIYKCLCIYTCGIRNSHLLELSLLPWTWLKHLPKILTDSLWTFSKTSTRMTFQPRSGTKWNNEPSSGIRERSSEMRKAFWWVNPHVGMRSPSYEYEAGLIPHEFLVIHNDLKGLSLSWGMRADSPNLLLPNEQ